MIWKHYINMIQINGLLDSVNSDLNLLIDIIRSWFKKIDELFFSDENVFIELNSRDIKLIENCKECYDKLLFLSFKKNVVIKGVEF